MGDGEGRAYAVCGTIAWACEVEEGEEERLEVHCCIVDGEVGGLASNREAGQEVYKNRVAHFPDIRFGGNEVSRYGRSGKILHVADDR